MKIGNRVIGDGPCYIIAEAGANFHVAEDHEVNFAQARKMIEIAAASQADAIKFQLYRAKKLYARDAGFADYLGQAKPIGQIIRELEMPYEWLPRLKAHSQESGIDFLCTPFDEESADALEAEDITAYKIASYTISHIPLLKHIARKGRPMLLSTGASVNVPLFVEQGEWIKVDTRTGEYVERAKR